MEGFCEILTNKKKVASRGKHEFDFPNDIIRNDEKVESQKKKKRHQACYKRYLG